MLYYFFTSTEYIICLILLCTCFIVNITKNYYSMYLCSYYYYVHLVLFLLSTCQCSPCPISKRIHFFSLSFDSRKKKFGLPFVLKDYFLYKYPSSLSFLFPNISHRIPHSLAPSTHLFFVVEKAF
jgi:hypothetical protein